MNLGLERFITINNSVQLIHLMQLTGKCRRGRLTTNHMGSWGSLLSLVDIRSWGCTVFLQKIFFQVASLRFELEPRGL